MRLTCPSVVVVSALSLVGLFPGAARAQEPAQMLKGMLGSRFVVFREKVQDELKLTSEQRSKLNDRVDVTIQETQEFFQSVQDAKPEDRQKKQGEYAQKANQKLETLLKETLKEDQLKRLRQIGLQHEGLFAIGMPDVSKELKITDEQRKQFMEVVQSFQKKVQPLIKEMQEGGDPQEIQPKMMKLRKDHQVQIEAILTDAQKQQWKEMIGKPFSVED